MFTKGANEITIKDIEDFLNGDGVATPATVTTEESSPATQPGTGTDSGTDPVSAQTAQTNVTETQAFAHRLKEATNKVRNEERESIAKSLGYESYADMQAKREAKLLEEKGLDPDDVSPVVEQIVQQRIAENPLMKELDRYRQEKVNEWAKKELAELGELTEGKISKLEDVPKDVIELWKTKGSLKAAYLELHGEELIRKMRTSVASGQNRSTTSHMNSPQGNHNPPSGSNKRPFTQKERDVYKLFNPGVTDEQLSKMYKEN
jgi:uncharacterized protein (UPF0332 family)